MTLNKTSGNMYPWVTHTWNPLRGECKHYCKYCYMKKGFLGNLDKYSGPPELDEDAMDTNLGTNNTIFVCSATDLFGDWVPSYMIEKVLDYCRAFSTNTYLFQSKNPPRLERFIDKLPEDSIIGTTLETNRSYDVSKAPEPSFRFEAFSNIDYPRKMVSIEPIMDFLLTEFVGWISEIDPEFVSIGADSKGSGLPEPDSQRIDNLISSLNHFVDVKTKDNLDRLRK